MPISQSLLIFLCLMIQGGAYYATEFIQGSNNNILCIYTILSPRAIWWRCPTVCEGTWCHHAGGWWGTRWQCGTLSVVLRSHSLESLSSPTCDDCCDMVPRRCGNGWGGTTGHVADPGSDAVGSVTSCLFGMSSVFCRRARQRSVAAVQSTGSLDESLLWGWLSMSRRSDSSGCCTLVRRREIIASLLMSGGVMLLSTGSYFVFCAADNPRYGPHGMI